MRVMIPQRSRERIEPQLRARIPKVEPVWMADDGSLHDASGSIDLERAALRAAWANTEVYVGGPVREFMIACLKSETLRFVQSSAAGFDHPVFGMLVDRGILLANSDAAAIAIAEFIVSSVLDAFQPNARRRELQAARRWERTPFREVYGTTWLVVGLGHIGTEVAIRARAFGARVVGVRRSPRGDEPTDRVVTPDALRDWLGESDVVALCAPANRDTRHLVDSDFIARMRPRSVLVNIGRGALVDEAALLDGLAQGRPDTAVLDVFEQEPLPEDSPFWSHPRVRVSAHNAANGDGFVARNDALFLDNLARFAAGRPLRHVVDPDTVRTSVQGHRDSAVTRKF